MKNFKTQEEFISKIKDSLDKSRPSLSGHRFKIYGDKGDLIYEVEVGRLVGTGSSCLVYEVIIDDNYPPKKNMIMKEFFPTFPNDSIKGVRDKENPHIIHYESKNEEDLINLVRDQKKFIESYDKHIKVIDIDPVLEDRIVRPYKLEKSSDYIFALYDIDKAQSVDKYYNLDLARIISILKQSSEILSLLHQKDIIYMDLKPANILYDYKRDTVKLFDFDAAVFLDDLDNTNEFYMPKQRAFIPPELRYVSNINKRKDIFISEEIDLYMLGVTFFYLLMDRYPEDLENENMVYLARNIKEVLLKKSNRIFLNNQTTDRIIDLLKESLSIHRYLTVNEFSERLDEIQRGLDTSKNKSISNLLSAAYIMDSFPLYNYISKDENVSYIDIALVGSLSRGRELFNLLFASVDLIDVEIRFNIYNENPKKAYQQMTKAMPLLKETCHITINGKVKDDNINHKITDKAYAKLNFSSDLDMIESTYIIILHDDSKNYYDLGFKLFDKFKDRKENHIILNYTRYTNNLDSKEINNLTLFNIDIASAASFRSKEYSESILEEAYNVHRFYTRAYKGERVDDNEIWQDFIRDDLHSVKSSIRSALSMRYRVYMAGSYQASDIARDFYEKVVKPGQNTKSISLRNIFADREHHTWNRFMITQGYRRPSKEEFKSYAYIGSNNHIDRIHKLHPLIANTGIKKFKNGQDDEFEKVCNEIYEYLYYKTQDLDKKVMDRISHSLNNTNWYTNDTLMEIFPLWEELYNVTDRMIDQEAFAINTLKQLMSIIDEIFEKDFYGKDDLFSDYKLIKQDIDLLIERNQKKSFRYSDYMIIDAKPLIKNGSIKTIFTPFIKENELLWANVIAAIKFSPQNLILLTDDKDKYREKFDRIVSFMKDRRMQRSLNIEIISYDEMTLYSKESAIVDLTLNTHTDANREEFDGLEYVEYLGSNKWGGNYKAVDYYTNERSLTVEETFFLNNAKFYNATSESNLARLSNYYEKLWLTYLYLPSYKWQEFTRIFRHSMDQYIIDLSYPKDEKTNMMEIGDFIFRRDDKVKYSKLTSFLDNLKKEGIVIDYKYPTNPGRLKLQTINDNLTIRLGEFISNNLKKYFQNFDLRKLYFPLIYNEKPKNFYCYVMSDNLDFSYKVAYKDGEKLADDLNNMMINLDKSINDDKELRVFNQKDKKEYVSYKDGYLDLNYEMGDIAFREFFEKGIALQVYTYFELIKKSSVFDEIKVDVRLKWKAYGDLTPISQAVGNHIDVVCTKEFSTFIISCIQEELKKEDVYEIKAESEQFGIDTKPILINSYSDGIEVSVKKIAKACGVYIIDRQMLKENGVVGYLENIARADQNWKNIEN
ncbi:protein kinase domain-containing protein [Anaerococcus sp.]|uniref:protein kinase domain-containing protein n=1 Tax=Anaerococcus sp. TaxID=1872515 RepID=UPI00258F3812|nr:hypothetical protein [Anaerococcus sp.]MDU3210694.1 hypothetical protein [Anaerococcus sp.]